MGKRIKTQTIKPLPQDIIQEIFVYLPVKSLLRFKSVSKPCQSLISSKHFTRLHLKKSTELTRHKLLYGSGRRVGSYSLISFLDARNYDECCTVATSVYHDYPFTPKHDHCGYFNSISCNGLILLTISHDLIFWNPSTRQQRIIPAPPPDNEPDRSVYGFGYDDSTDDYKVVSMLFSYSVALTRYKTPYKTRMYSLRNNSWKEIANFAKGYMNGQECPGTFMYGKLHWLVAERRDGGDLGILSLSLVDERYDFVAVPRKVSKFKCAYACRLDDLGGYLSLIRNESIVGVTIWTMMKYGDVETWTNICALSIRPLFEPEPWPLWLTKDGDVVVSNRGPWVFVSDGKKKSLKYRVYVVDAEIDPWSIYVESLVSPFL